MAWASSFGPVECDGGIAVAAHVAPVRHLFLRRVLDTDYRCKWRRLPARGHSCSKSEPVWRVSECDIVRVRAQRFNERQRIRAVHPGELAGAEHLDVVLERAKAARMILDEVGRRGAARERLEAKGP